jgi:hypothetical protein
VIAIFIFLLIYLEVYAASLVIYFLIKLVKYRKLPGIILIINFFLLGGFFFLQRSVSDHQIIFVGGYGTATKDWGEGFANAMFTIYNLAIVFFVFCFTQLLFWIFFLKAYRKLNYSKSDLDFSF